jgi:hypothetical protein
MYHGGVPLVPFISYPAFEEVAAIVIQSFTTNAYRWAKKI